MKRKKNKKARQNRVDYIDQYLYGEHYSDRYDPLRNKGKKNDVEKAHLAKTVKRCILTVTCLAVFCLGYFFMYVIMERNAMPSDFPQPVAVSGQEDNPAKPNVNDADVALNAKYIPSYYLDGGKMMEAVIQDAINDGYNAVMFDLKRRDGTLAYPSNLTAAATYRAIADPGADIKKSIDMLYENNLVPLARVYCFSDNTAALADPALAVTDAAGQPWRSPSGRYWLNPYSAYAVEYLTSIILEIQELGINSILLDGVSLPDGNLENAKFPGLEGAPPAAQFATAFLADLRGKTNNTTRLMLGTDLTLASEADLPGILASCQTAQKDGTVPVITLTLPVQTAMKALSDANVRNYIFILTATQAEESSTEMELPE